MVIHHGRTLFVIAWEGLHHNLGSSRSAKRKRIAFSSGVDPKALLGRLTPRERDLVEEIRAGRSNKAIAANLGVKEQTIRNQLTVLFRKLGVSSRLELVVKLTMPDNGGT
jgi:DNA-binding NarL/FixJ family response regulator